MRFTKHPALTAGVAAVLVALGNPVHADDHDATYSARLLPLNTAVTKSDSVGEATFTISGDRLTIAVTADAVPSSIVLLQHFLGFADGDRTA
jgi:hypothetical protein